MFNISDDEFQKLEWEEMDGLKLDEFITGMKILGTEPCDYPLTDSMTTYLQAEDGSIYAMDIGERETLGIDKDDDLPPIFIKIAKIK